MSNVFHSHSIIPSHPYTIDYSIFPKVKEVEWIEIDVYPHQYVFIPANWYHWIESDEHTLAITYEILSSIPFNDSTWFSQKRREAQPIHLSSPNPIPYSKHEFLSHHNDTIVHLSHSTSPDVSPVNKTGKEKDESKWLEINKLSTLYQHDKDRYPYCYMMVSNNSSRLSLREYNDLTTILPNHGASDIQLTVWLNTYKNVNSGLHNDTSDRILLVLEGHKRIRLADPKWKPNLYITPLPRSNLVTHKES